MRCALVYSFSFNNQDVDTVVVRLSIDPKSIAVGKTEVAEEFSFEQFNKQVKEKLSKEENVKTEEKSEPSEENQGNFSLEMKNQQSNIESAIASVKREHEDSGNDLSEDTKKVKVETQAPVYSEDEEHDESNEDDQETEE